jgi:hypothetical protein
MLQNIQGHFKTDVHHVITVSYVPDTQTSIKRRISNIIKGKIQHDKTFAAAAAIATTINLKKNLIRARLPN